MTIKRQNKEEELRVKKLKKFLDRRHPMFAGMLPHWEFLEQTYEGGRQWFATNIHRYLKEGDREYSDRVARAYRFNHTREVVDLVDKYLFKMEIKRNDEDAPESVKSFWKKATLGGQSIREFAKSVSTRASTFGRVWVVIDTNADATIKTVAEEKQVGARTYAYVVKPQHALDMSVDELGELNWILFLESYRDDEDPIESTGEVRLGYRLWTRTYSQAFKVEGKDLSGDASRLKIIEEQPIVHDLGFVPVIQVDNVISDERYTSPSMVADVAYLDRACANYLSNLDAIIQDQTFSQLAMPAEGVTPGDDAYDKLTEMGTKRIFLYEGGGGSNQPFYLSPDVKQSQLLLQAISKIINEIYHSVGLAGERTKEDNAQGIDNSSGVAKAYDFERVNSLLAAKADSLQTFENRLAFVVASYSEEGKRVDELEKPLINYPDNFDVRGLYDEFEIAARLALVEAPDEVRREQMKSVIEKLFPQISSDLQEKMAEELKNWPPKIDPLTGAAQGNGGIDVLSKTGKAALSTKLVKGSEAQV